ncbi:MAG: acyl-CoA thioesterase [Lachnospiraceae bacterium]|nr:acyl-CoA thioesterase [Lachnospiraceae bacterium]
MRDVWIFECEAAPRLDLAPVKEFESIGWYTADEVSALFGSGEADPSAAYFAETVAPVPGFAVKRLGYKTVSESVAELTRILRYPDINGQHRLFGGKLLEMIDEIGAIAAMRHAGMNVTTVSIEHLEFKRGAFLNDMIVLIAKVTHVGKSSIEVRVDTWMEDLPSGRRTIINRAFFTEVCINAEGRPVPVPYGLILETESEKARWEGAEKRVRQRKKAKREGY